MIVDNLNTNNFIIFNRAKGKQSVLGLATGTLANLSTRAMWLPLESAGEKMVLKDKWFQFSYGHKLLAKNSAYKNIFHLENKKNVVSLAHFPNAFPANLNRFIACACFGILLGEK